ncbi:MAG: SAF domain-containing protein [Acetatifactor sp.]|nr:SAF domain-containing protein [Acetatifactor sp.]
MKVSKQKNDRNYGFGIAVAAFVAAIAVFAIMLQVKKNTLEAYEKKSIYILKEDIPAGTLIDETVLEKSMELKEVPAELAVSDSVGKSDEVKGFLLAGDMKKGSILYKGGLKRTDPLADELRDPVIVSVCVDELYKACGGTLRKGDTVDIYVTEDDSARLMWEDVRISDAFDKSGNRILNTDINKTAYIFNLFFEKNEVVPFYKNADGSNIRLVYKLGREKVNEED